MIVRTLGRAGSSALGERFFGTRSASLPEGGAPGEIECEDGAAACLVAATDGGPSGGVCEMGDVSKRAPATSECTANSRQ